MLTTNSFVKGGTKGMGKNQKAEMLYQLDRPGVDQVADALSAWMEEAGVGRPDRLRIRLTMETLLLNVSEHTI